nr:hypothetical protein [Maliibacterium massiliense]
MRRKRFYTAFLTLLLCALCASGCVHPEGQAGDALRAQITTQSGVPIGQRKRGGTVKGRVSQATPEGLPYSATGRTYANYAAQLSVQVAIYNTVGRRVASNPRETAYGMNITSSITYLSPEICQFCENTWRADDYTGRVRLKFLP